MAREKIKLSVERHGEKIRYKKTHRGERFVSRVFEQDSRRNRQEAWQEFKIWREQGHEQHGEQAQRDDPHAVIRSLITMRLEKLAEYSRLTHEPYDPRWGQMLADVRDADPRQLHALLALCFGDVDGESFRDVFEDRERAVDRIKRNADPELAAGVLVEDFVNSYKRRAETGQGSIGRYGLVRSALDVFVNWYGKSRTLEGIDETTVKDYTDFLLDRTEDKDKPISLTTASEYQSVFRTFIQAVCEDNTAVQLPNNLHSKRLRISKSNPEPDPWTVEEIKLALDNATERTQLYLLLMLNCGMYQGDIADLTADQVDWRHGRITRTRSKKKRLKKGQKVGRINWKLWDKTFELLCKLGNREGLVLTKMDGTPLVRRGIGDKGRDYKQDACRQAFRNLVTKLKGHKKLPEDWHKTPKQIRKTGANLLEKSKDHGEFYALFLEHSSVSRLHYLTDGEPVPKFDAALKWLGDQFGLPTSS